jgi:hypothetical protein
MPKEGQVRWESTAHGIDVYLNFRGFEIKTLLLEI